MKRKLLFWWGVRGWVGRGHDTFYLGGVTCGSFCNGRFMHPGWAWGRLGGGAVPTPPSLPWGWAEKTRH